MEIVIKEYTKSRFSDCVIFELALRKEENFWGWEIDEAYKTTVLNSFSDKLFKNAISFLAYVDKKVAFAGGIIITFAREILNLITG